MRKKINLSQHKYSKRLLIIMLGLFMVLPSILPSTYAEIEQENSSIETIQESPMIEQNQEDEIETEANDASNEDDAKSAEEPKNKVGEIKSETNNGFSVSAVINKDAEVPSDTKIEATELGNKTTQEKECFSQYEESVIKALKEDLPNFNEIKFIKLYDISLVSDGQAIQPASTVNVKIEYDKAIGLNNADDIRIVHFAEWENGEVNAEVLNAEVSVNNKNKLEEASFDTEGFSVYAVVGIESVSTSYLSADGKTYNITVTFDERENLSGDTVLNVSEIASGTDAYNDYLNQTAQAMSLDSANCISEARFFDIEIEKDGEKYEPEYPTTVTLQYADGLNVEDDSVVNIAHFTEDGVELISDIDVSSDGTKLVYQQDSFSVTGSVLVNSSGTNIFDTAMMIVSYNSKYYAVDADLNLYEVTMSSTSGTTTVTFKDEDLQATTNADVSALAPFLWGKSNATNNGNSSPGIISAKGEYLQLYPNKGEYDGTGYPTTDVITSADIYVESSGSSNSWDDDDDETNYATLVYNSSNEITQIVHRPSSITKWSDNSYSETKTYGMKIDSSGDTPKLISDASSTSGRCKVYFVKPNTTSEDTSGTTTSSSFTDAELGAPTTSKYLVDNGDGTYNLSLSVTGESKASNESIGGDVMLIMDTSNSMRDADMRTAKAAAVTFGNNLKDTTDNIKLALETYSGTASWPGIHLGFTSSSEYFESVVNTTLASQTGNTNWQDAFDDAKTFCDTYSKNGAPRYIVFMSDGKPNAYGSSGTAESYTCLIYDDFETADEVDGWASSKKSISNTNPTSLSNAVSSAQALMNAYSSTKIFFVTTTHDGDNTGYDYRATKYYMQKLAKSVYGSNEAASKYFFEANHGNLEEILGEVATAISKDYPYANVKITDGMTSGVKGTTVDGSVGNFSYTIKKYDIQVTYPYTLQEGEKVGTTTSEDGVITSIIEKTDSSTGAVTYVKNIKTPTDVEATITPITGTNNISVSYPAEGTVRSDDYVAAETVVLKGAEYDSDTKSVVWDIKQIEDGEETDYILRGGYTYTVSFDVWPSQEVYDAIAALKNGTSWDDLSDEVKVSIDQTTYTFKTNTSCTVDYSIVSLSDDGETVITSQTPITIANPPNQSVLGTNMVLEKLWHAGLQNSQFTDMYGWTYASGEEPHLHLKQDDASSSTYYDEEFNVMPIASNLPDGYTMASAQDERSVNDGKWPILVDPDNVNNETNVYQTLYQEWSIAPGLMTETLPNGVDENDVTIWTYNGTTYYVLEAGHDYTVDEDYIGENLKSVHKKYHPMQVGTELYNVTVKNNVITSMEVMDPDTLTVHNYLKNYKNTNNLIITKASEGNYVDANQDYEVTVVLSGLDGGDAYTYKINDNESTFTASSSGTVSVTLSIKAGDVVEFEDLPIGATYLATASADEYISSYEITDSENAGSIVQTTDANTEPNTELSTQTETVDGEETVTITFTSTRNLALPTGANTVNFTFDFIIMLIALLAFMYNLKRKRTIHVEL